MPHKRSEGHKGKGNGGRSQRGGGGGGSPQGGWRSSREKAEKRKKKAATTKRKHTTNPLLPEARLIFTLIRFRLHYGKWMLKGKRNESAGAHMTAA